MEVADFAVRLRGSVRSYLECCAAERAASRVRGVMVVRNEVYVDLPAAHARTDRELTAEVRRALEFNVAVPADRLAVSVEAGCVVLEGMVDRDAQRRKAEDVVAGLVGVRQIANQITLAPRLVATVVMARTSREARDGAILVRRRTALSERPQKTIALK